MKDAFKNALSSFKTAYKASGFFCSEIAKQVYTDEAKITWDRHVEEIKNLIKNS
jgi:hypothetical protein